MTAGLNTGNRGVSLVILMMAIVVILGLTGSVVSLVRIDTSIAMNYRRSVGLLYAAEAALELVVQDFGRVGSWDQVLRGRTTSRLWSRDPRVVMIDGTVLDLAQVTADLLRGRGVATRSAVWRFAGQTQLESVSRVQFSSEPNVVAVWLSDDLEDNDGDPLSDSNMRLSVYAVAFGAGRSRRAIQATVRRHVAGWVEVTSWRLVR